MERPLTYYGNPVLREKGKAVEAFDSDLNRLVGDMIETMYAEEGIGLAAQQIGCSTDLRCRCSSTQRKRDSFQLQLRWKIHTS